jgi:hypothetical protein
LNGFVKTQIGEICFCCAVEHLDPIAEAVGDGDGGTEFSPSAATAIFVDVNVARQAARAWRRLISVSIGFPVVGANWLVSQSVHFNRGVLAQPRLTVRPVIK